MFARRCQSAAVPLCRTCMNCVCVPFVLAPDASWYISCVSSDFYNFGAGAVFSCPADPLAETIFQLDKTDEMQCWETDECPVEDEQKFTKAWHIHSAEKNPTTETHFDSEVSATLAG